MVLGWITINNSSNRSMSLWQFVVVGKYIFRDRQETVSIVRKSNIPRTGYLVNNNWRAYKDLDDVACLEEEDKEDQRPRRKEHGIQFVEFQQKAMSNDKPQDHEIISVLMLWMACLTGKLQIPCSSFLWALSLNDIKSSLSCCCSFL